MFNTNLFTSGSPRESQPGTPPIGSSKVFYKQSDITANPHNISQPSNDDVPKKKVTLKIRKKQVDLDF
jgi:hypothetical protein